MKNKSKIPWRSIFDKESGHYNIYSLEYPEMGVDLLRMIFPDGKANEMNFVLFSTSGVHGTYANLDEIEKSLKKYGQKPKFLNDESGEEIPDDYVSNEITFVVIHPRIVQMKFGNMVVELKDIPYLRKLAKSSIAAVKTIQKGNI